MLCVRCSHALPPRADRCVRCFALNPENRPAPAPRALHDSGPAAPLQVSLASDPPVAPVSISFDDERTPALLPQPSAAVTEPDPDPVLTPRFAVPAAPRPRKTPALDTRPVLRRAPRPESRRERKLALPLEAEPALPFDAEPALPFEAEPALPFEAEPALPFDAEPALPFDAEPALPFEAEPPRAAAAPALAPRSPSLASAGARLVAWSLDAALIGATSAACIAASLRVSHVRYPLDFLRAAAPLYGALVLLLCVAYAALLTALCGRTPGMALAGHHLLTLDGRPPTAAQAMGRAFLALPSAALGLFGFSLALFDRRGQTLHDKLSGCITVVD